MLNTTNLNSVYTSLRVRKPEKVKAAKNDVTSERSALVSDNTANPGMNTENNGGGGRGHEGSRSGCTSGGRGQSGQSDVDRDKFYYTHCGRYRHTHETCWNLVSRNHDVFGGPG